MSKSEIKELILQARAMLKTIKTPHKRDELRHKIKLLEIKLRE